MRGGRRRGRGRGGRGRGRGRRRGRGRGRGGMGTERERGACGAVSGAVARQSALSPAGPPPALGAKRDRCAYEAVAGAPSCSAVDVGLACCFCVSCVVAPAVTREVGRLPRQVGAAPADHVVPDRFGGCPGYPTPPRPRCARAVAVAVAVSRRAGALEQPARRRESSNTAHRNGRRHSTGAAAADAADA